MNYSIIRNILGKIMIMIASLMLLPLLVSVIYQECITNFFAFLIPIAALFLIGLLFNIKKAKNSIIYVREGFIIVGLSWLIITLFGCLPFIISKEIPNFFDAFFEMSSGFTTTGASILDDPTKLSHSIKFWRSFSHWIGGMGVLVFILAIIPESKEGSSLHILRAESPGPQVGKLVSRMQVTSRILYIIYIVLTIIEVLFLWLGPDKDMNLFNSLVYSLGTAGTGGFAIHSKSIELFTNYSQYVIAIFMLIFSVNFSLYYLLLIRNFKEVFKNEELITFISIVIISIVIIFFNTYSIYQNVEQTFRVALFQVASIISTTGYSTTDFNTWPALSQGVIVILMFFGACAGSTAGGIKLTRINILFKTAIRKIKNSIAPRKIDVITIDEKPLSENTIEGVQTYIVIYIIVFATCALLISIDNHDILTNITASLACISNVGPGLGLVGPYGSYSVFSNFSKFILSLEMIAGRLELLPILLLFNPKTWSRAN